MNTTHDPDTCPVGYPHCVDCYPRGFAGPPSTHDKGGEDYAGQLRTGDYVTLVGALSVPRDTVALVTDVTQDRAGTLVHVRLADGRETSLCADKVHLRDEPFDTLAESADWRRPLAAWARHDVCPNCGRPEPGAKCAACGTEVQA
jgi:hypothetical protein